MASAAIFSSLRRRRSPCLEAFLAPVDLTEVALVQTLATISSELISCFTSKVSFFQRRNYRSLIRKMEVFLVMLECLRDSGSGSMSSLPATAILCFKELYLLLYRSKILLEYCAQSSKLWLLLQNLSISGHFHDLNQEISTLLDVFPLNDVGLSDDVREQIVAHEGDIEPTACVLNGFVAVTRYCRFLLFGFEEDEVKLPFGNQKKPRKGLIAREIADTFITIPKDFCCPISLDLMTDPVIISTGQTYDRRSIVRWMEEGHCTCPKTGQCSFILALLLIEL
ncbi:hypothetical protein V6N13_033663 [Hibiscus sabdariffa]